MATYRNKTYVCFDADTDMWAYRFMKGWKNNDRIDFDFHDAHDLNNLRDGSSEATIKAKLKERMKSTKLLIVLVGEKTKNLHRFVRWEMEIALELDIPIVAVYLNLSRTLDKTVCPPIIRDELVLHIPYKQAAIKWAIDNWITNRKHHRSKKDNGPIVLTDNLYKELGI
ncbi:TIR domain-containing protein [Flavobacterium sp.]|uniref:TIR domain-containing protein n=1 Tax=Flavobacterium sp. TaxID=239 RepID=UPI00404712BE